MQLITKNKKTMMSDAQSTIYTTGIVQLYPNKTLCPSATKECIATCLVHSGMGRMPNVIKARKERSKLYMNQRDDFWIQLDAEITIIKTRLKSKGKKLALRVNGFSDIKIPKKILVKHNDVQFYDYTKNFDFLAYSLKYPNYHLTFSFSGHNHKETKKALKKGFNVAIVAHDITSLNNTLKRININKINSNKININKINVVNGDNSDLRFLDPKNSIIHLTPKGVKKTLTNAFIN